MAPAKQANFYRNSNPSNDQGAKQQREVEVWSQSVKGT